MTTLITGPNLTHPDDTYAMLLAAHHGLTKDQSYVLNAALILILCNHIGDQSVIGDALKLAKP